MSDNLSGEEFLTQYFPQVLEEAKKRTREGEIRRGGEQSPELAGFLWEHVLRVAQIAYQLALKAGIQDVNTVVLSALLHDVGKFSGGEYNSEDIREEEISAEIAAEILESGGLPEDLVRNVKQTINQLYSNASPSEMTCLVHDADRLDKTGMMGLVNFFQKWTLRGLKLSEIIEQKIGPEITYLAHLKNSLKTQVAKDSCPSVQGNIEDLENLISEYNRISGKDLRITPYSFEGKKIYAVQKAQCTCGKPYIATISKTTTIKCDLVLLELTCQDCKDVYWSSSICFSRL
ncbi:MAG: HD domain-containing protein [Candidatus Thorarchaeota archaeon]